MKLRALEMQIYLNPLVCVVWLSTSLVNSSFTHNKQNLKSKCTRAVCVDVFPLRLLQLVVVCPRGLVCAGQRSWGTTMMWPIRPAKNSCMVAVDPIRITSTQRKSVKLPAAESQVTHKNEQRPSIFSLYFIFSSNSGVVTKLHLNLPSSQQFHFLTCSKRYSLRVGLRWIQGTRWLFCLFFKYMEGFIILKSVCALFPGFISVIYILTRQHHCTRVTVMLTACFCFPIHSLG